MATDDWHYAIHITVGIGSLPTPIVGLCFGATPELTPFNPPSGLATPVYNWNHSHFKPEIKQPQLKTMAVSGRPGQGVVF